MEDNSNIAEAARAQAEARRKRILEKAEKRMGLVSGEQGQDEEEKKQSASKAARIRAARQRRYGKKTASKGQPDTQTGSEIGSVVKESVPATATEADLHTKEEAPSQAPSQAPPKDEGIKSVKEEEKSVEATEEEPKKKYLGVAKMRRKMILKKKNAQTEDSSTKELLSTKTNTDQQRKRIITETATLPIYMHIVTILLLFLAGMDVGLQQYHEDVKIYSNLALNDFGIPLIHRGLWDDNDKGGSLETLQADSSSHDSAEDPVCENEFEDLEEEVEKIANIDPLFRVDLDHLTKGPGLLNWLARGAVSVHRFVLKLVFYTPISIIQTLVGIPKALMQSPPALCLLALLLRHLVGKTILRAGLPLSDGDDKNSAIDVLTMAKQWATKFLSSTFPTAVVLYDAFVHLRSDMYIIVCGVFCGMAWTHMSQISGHEEIDLGAEEIVSVGTDEL